MAATRGEAQMTGWGWVAGMQGHSMRSSEERGAGQCRGARAGPGGAVGLWKAKGCRRGLGLRLPSESLLLLLGGVVVSAGGPRRLREKNGLHPSGSNEAGH